MDVDLGRILNSMPGMILASTPDGEIEFANAKWRDFTGPGFGRFIDQDWQGSINPDDLSATIRHWHSIVASGEAGDMETRLRRFDGEYRRVKINCNPVREDDGGIVRWYALATDIEDLRSLSDDKLRRSIPSRQQGLDLRGKNCSLTPNEHPDDRLVSNFGKTEEIIDTLPTAAWSTLPDGFVDFLNDPWLDYAGMSMEQAGGFGWAAAIHPDDAERLLGYWQVCLESGAPVDIEARFRRFDGAYRWFMFRANPLRDEAGNIIKWYGTNIDIEDRRIADEALQRERQSRLIVDTIPGMIALFTPNGELDGANHQLLEYFDQPLEEVKHWATNGMTHPDDLKRCIDAFHESIRTGEPYEVETRLLRRDGVYRWFLIGGRPLRDDDGNVVRWYGLLTDIDGRKGAEERSRRSEAFLADTQRVSRTGSFAWLIGSERITWSEETYRIYDFDPDQPVTLDLIRSRVHPDNIAAFEQVMTGAHREGTEFDYETRLVMRDQSIKYVRVVARNERNKDGELELRGAVRDVTASYLAEEALNKARSDLAHVARVTSLGVLTASIAHEIYQPLSGIITNADTCLRLLAEDPPNIEVVRETARRTIRDGNRASDVIARLRGLFSKNPFAIEAVDLNQAVQEVIALYRGDLERNRVILRTDFADDLPQVAGDRVQLQQVILNLLRNANEALSSISGRLRQLQVSTHRFSDGQVLFSVKDAGVGFGDGDPERVFEAFYSTKSDGMGIGLSVSQSIIGSHNGRLWATRNDGPGVTVSFCIPEYAGNEESTSNFPAAQAIRNIANTARTS